MRPLAFKAVRDGLSHTALVAESAGRPDSYRYGTLVKRFDINSLTDTMDNHVATWAVSTDFVWLALDHVDHGINATNRGIYAFHGSGANIVFCDGSVRFLSDSTHVERIHALISRDRHDVYH
jgi:prepilin-type processing-associated H-X9-DG protein